MWENRGANETEGNQGPRATWLEPYKKNIDDGKTIPVLRSIDEQPY